jgi:hypothetical protein
MDKEQQKRMASRSFVQQDKDQVDIEYTVQVSGDRVEISRHYEEPWEEEDGGYEEQHECWIMSKDTLKAFMKAAQWCIQKSEVFEASHAAPDGFNVERSID